MFSQKYGSLHDNYVQKRNKRNFLRHLFIMLKVLDWISVAFFLGEKSCWARDHVNFELD